MGWLSTLLGGGVKEVGEGASAALNGAGDAAIKIRSAITGKITPEKKAELELGLQEIESNLAKAQADINLQDSKGSPFQRNWRPLIGYIAAGGICYHFIFMPLFYDLFLQYFKFALQPIDGTTLMSLVITMLGMGTMRTLEKFQGVQNNH